MNYLLIGPEEYLKDQFVEKLKKTLLDGNTGRLNLEILHGGGKDINRLPDSFNTLPFDSNHRITLIRDVEKCSSKEKDSILKYLKSPLSSTTLVLTSSLSLLSKFLSDVSKRTKCIKYWRLRPGDLDAWIKGEFARHKKNASLKLSAHIGETVGDDLYLLKNEIEKISTFAGSASDISEDHIEMVLGKGTHKTSFELVDLISKKQREKIVACLNMLLPREKPHQILNLIAWQFRNFLKIKNIKNNPTPEEISRILGARCRYPRRILENSRAFSRAELERGLSAILEADLYMKTGQGKAEYVLEQVLVKLCA
ncbi:MAG: DNA polymerase III subunit delta [Candidatus Omnitrophota bacterium]